MNIKRILNHLSISQTAVKRCFSSVAMASIEQAIRHSEATHAGQICFAVEASLPLKPLLQQQTARTRAIQVFTDLRVWDTAHNNGVLIYLLLADRDVEIVADRGIHAHLGAAGWEAICQAMEAAFRAGRFEQGVLTGIAQITQQLAQHYPVSTPQRNELPDRPIVL